MEIIDDKPEYSLEFLKREKKSKKKQNEDEEQVGIVGSNRIIMI